MLRIVNYGGFFMNLKDYIYVLNNIDLFKNFTEKDFDLLFTNLDYKILRYTKGSMVFIANEECSALNIILDGNIRIQKIDSFGKSLVIAEFKSGDTVGEALLFGEKNVFPMTGISTSTTTMLYIPKEAILYLCQQNDVFLSEFLKLLSGKSVTLSNKLDQISLKTIRQKICEFIMIEYRKTNKMKIKLNMSKKELADKMGIQRPSLSRELIKLKKEELIDYDKHYIYIKNLEEIMFVCGIVKG